MGPLILNEPTRVLIPDLDVRQRQLLTMALSYKDQRAFFEYQRFKRLSWYAERHGVEAWQEELEKRKKAVDQCLLFEDPDGRLWTYSGLALKVAELLGTTVENHIKYPEPGYLGWDKKPEFNPYPYQTACMLALMQVKHGGDEIGTGLGKSFIIQLLVKEMGLKTVVMAPSTDIARRLYDDFVTAFGKRYVGLYGDGKKEFKKLITVGISASLTKIPEGSDAWNALGQTQVFIADESHQCPAATLARVCFGLVKNAPYRWFFSATQLRQDGLDLLLDAITGPIVYRMTVREGIDQGYLSKLKFMMVNVGSSSTYESRDVNEMTREHLFYNQKTIQAAASLINRFVGEYDQQVLVLVEEFEQFTKLEPLLKFPVKFAHGGVSKDNRDKLPRPYHESDPSAFVKEFNAGEFPILVGTSCVSTGTDIKANEVTVNLQGGKSMIAVMQGPSGRSTRLFTYTEGRGWRRTPGKKRLCTVIDFDVVNIEALHRHAQARRSIYDSIYGPVQTVGVR